MISLCYLFLPAPDSSPATLVNVLLCGLLIGTKLCPTSSHPWSWTSKCSNDTETFVPACFLQKEEMLPLVLLDVNLQSSIQFSFQSCILIWVSFNWVIADQNFAFQSKTHNGTKNFFVCATCRHSCLMSIGHLFMIFPFFSLSLFCSVPSCMFIVSLFLNHLHN